MMFSMEGSADMPAAVSKALDLIFLLHADHEQNCSTSTCRMIASGGANPFASVAGASSALWGPLHGGANMAVIKMLNEREPKSLEVCCLLNKSSRRETDINVNWVGFDIPDEFVVGYGIDYAQNNRNLPYIGKVVQTN